MARPPIVQKLRHDRLLCGAVFRFFVETWNWLTSWVDNAKGDAEVDPQKGYITIDRSDPDSPIIRFRADRLPTSGGGSTVVPDDVSVNLIPDPPSGTQPTGDEGKLQIKGWKTGTPASTTSLASDINWEYTTEALVARDLTDGTLRYKPIGDLATLLGSQVSKANQKILTGLAWNTTNHTLVISSATVTIDHGVITAWTDNNNETISTTSINSIIN